MISRREEGVSDLIGVIILVAIAALAVGIIGSTFFSYVSVVSIPRAELSIIWQNGPEDGSDIKKPYIVFERGESLWYNSTRVKINDEGVDLSSIWIKKSGNNQYFLWNKTISDDGVIVPFSIGDTLKWDGHDQADNISITYIQAGNEILLMTGDRIPEK
ncbi:type IV pilin [Methanospirillum sp. J.3.6.1-F.2.7.3]|uniref:Type IV pilin n=2 Tax=Methanospirillum TaxID=2202 RepID=A0A8E7AW99_9EURY|nr:MULTISPECIES: type IV pilin [Methanospirillum]MDX8549116.1 type IV pilin [Methanospirillum hungatei]QVV88792.1 type IV pilin [Methanospirillum sp. J.3.6.1-F.2.7.3]QXO93868.1 type IV pilin N-terminal domain-containing protein [Methanospirillum hungatei]